MVSRKTDWTLSPPKIEPTPSDLCDVDAILQHGEDYWNVKQEKRGSWLYNW